MEPFAFLQPRPPGEAPGTLPTAPAPRPTDLIPYLSAARGALSGARPREAAHV